MIPRVKNDNSVLPMKSHSSDVTTSLDRKIPSRIFHERKEQVDNDDIAIIIKTQADFNHIKIIVKPLRHWNRHAGRISLWRHLRSKIWWFAEFCNSHCLSHFAAFFIGMGTKTSIVENFCISFFVLLFGNNIIIIIVGSYLKMALLCETVVVNNRNYITIAASFK